MKHRLSEVDPDTRRALCAVCGLTPIRRKSGGWWKCGTHARELQRQVRRPYVQHKGGVCERCGFVPESLRQLDVHHINGDHQDNREENLQTLCANCHRLF